MRFAPPNTFAFESPLSTTGVGKTATARASIWPVWSNSSRKSVKFSPMTKRQAVRLWHNARRFERMTRQPGRQDGALGRNGLLVLHTLLFDFLNFATGRLYPSHRSIAAQANISERSVRRGLVALKSAGVVNWLKRCIEEWIDGRFTLRQQSNAYAVLTETQWRGFVPREQAPKPDAGTWGDHPALPQAIELATTANKQGASLATVLAHLESDTSDPLTNALARLGRSFLPRLL